MATIQVRAGKKFTTYRVMVRHHSKYVQTNLSKSFRDREAAEAYVQEIEGKLTHNVKDKTEQILVVTFNDVLQRYEQEVERYKAESSIARERSIFQYWKSHLGEMALSNITPSLINQYMMAL